MKDVRIDKDGDLRCWNCGGKSFNEKRTTRAKVMVGVGALVTKKKLQCQVCWEYNDVGSAKPFVGPEGKKYQTPTAASEPNTTLKPTTAISGTEAKEKLATLLNSRSFEQYKGYNGVISLFDEHLTISREGRIAKMGKHGSGLRTIEFSSIVGVQKEDPTMAVNGYLQIQLLGEPVARLTKLTMGGDSNTVLFIYTHRKEQAELFAILDQVANLTNAINAESQAVKETQESAVPNSVSKIDQLSKIAELKNAGLISSEEFENLKTEIMGK
jgi:hypothetical protein